MRDAARNLVLTVAVFHNANALHPIRLVRLEDDDSERGTADAATSGYSYVGHIGVNRGEVAVAVEQGFEGAMAEAGYVVAGMIGLELQQLQLQGE